MKYLIGTTVIALVGDTANSRADQPVHIPPNTAGVVVDVLPDPDGNEVFVLFGPQDATTLISEESLADQRKYLTITPELTARMFERLRMSNHNLHCVLAAFAAKDYALAQTLARSERDTMAEFLRPLL